MIKKTIYLPLAITLIMICSTAQAFQLDPDNALQKQQAASRAEYSEIKQQFFYLKGLVERKRMHKKTLERLTAMRFYIPEIIEETARVKYQIKLVQEQIKEEKEMIARYRQEKQELQSELEKPRQVVRQPAQKSAFSRAWDWATAPKEVGQPQAQERPRETPEDTLARMRRELASYKKDTQALEQEIKELNNYISDTRKNLKATVRPEVWHRLETLDKAYSSLDNVYQTLDSLKKQKWELLEEIEGMEPEAF